MLFRDDPTRAPSWVVSAEPAAMSRRAHHDSQFSIRTHLLPETIPEAHREDGKKAGIAQIVIVTRSERSQILLEAGILIDRLAAYRS